jgi:WD40 repeat protein
MIWDANTGRQLQMLKGRTGGVDAVALSPDNRILASHTQDSLDIVLWDVMSGNAVRTLKVGVSAPRILSFSPDGRFLAAGGSGHAVGLWEMATGRPLHTFRSDKTGLRDRLRALSDKFNDEPSGNAACDDSAIAFSPDGQALAVGGEDGVVRLWATGTGRLSETLAGSDGEAHRGSRDSRGHVNERGERLPDRFIPLPSEDQQRRRLRLAARKVIGMAFSPAGRQMAIAVADTVQLWNLAGGVHVRTLQGHRGGVLTLTFSPDGGQLASSDSSTVYVWA